MPNIEINEFMKSMGFRNIPESNAYYRVEDHPGTKIRAGKVESVAIHDGSVEVFYRFVIYEYLVTIGIFELDSLCHSQFKKELFKCLI